MGKPYYTSSMFVTYLDGDKAWDMIEKKVMGQDVDLDDLYPEHFITEVTTKIYFTAEFMKMGWPFDIDTIKRDDDNNKWSYHYKGINHN